MPRKPTRRGPAPERKFPLSQRGRLMWQPGMPHALDALFGMATLAQEKITDELEQMQRHLQQFDQIVARAPSLTDMTTATESADERQWWYELRTRKHYHHAQAALAYIRRVRLTARLQAAQAALELAADLLAVDDTAATLTGKPGSSRAWRGEVRDFLAKIEQIRVQSGQGDGWFEHRYTRKTDHEGRPKSYGPYLAYRWREDDGRVYTVHLGRIDIEHDEAPEEFTPGAWSDYRVTAPPPVELPPDLAILEALRHLLTHAQMQSRDTAFVTSLTQQTKQLTPKQLRAAPAVCRRYLDQLEGVPLPTDEELTALTTEMDAAYRAAHSVIDADGEAFLVSFPYDDDLVAVVRTLIAAHGGTGWQPRTKQWQVGASAGADLAQQLPGFRWTEAADALADTEAAERERERQAQEAARRQRAATAQRLLADLDLGLPLPSGRTLFTHQQEAVRWLITANRGILADDLGLGKTTSSLVAAAQYNVPIVVVAPAGLRDNWQREAQYAGLPIQFHSWAKVPAPPAHPYVVIADEASYMQTWESQRTQALIDLARDLQCQAVFLLSGTPIKHGRPVNLYPLLYALDHSLAAKRRAYEAYFCAAHATGWTSWDTSGASHLDELHAQTQDVILRRTKDECLDLPPKLRVMQPAIVNQEAKQRYDTTLRDLRRQYQERLVADEISTGGELLVMLNHLRHAGSVTKVTTALEIADEVQEQGGQVVLCTAFVASATQIAATLTERDIPTGLITGETATKDRDPQIQRFQVGELRAFVLTLGAGGVGITLTAAQTVVLVDRPWSPGDAIQAEDRLHRIGQTGSVTAIWVQYGEIDAQIDTLLEEKAIDIGEVLTGDRERAALPILRDLATRLFG